MNLNCVAITLLICLTGADAGTAGSAAEKHPITNVIDLVQKLKADTVAEGQAEQALFEKFQYWCSTSKDTLTNAIAEEKETITELTDEKAGLQKQLETLKAALESLTEELKEMDDASSAAQNNRDAEANDYENADKDFQNTVTAINKCIATIEGAEAKTEKSASLAQHHVKMVLALVSTKVTESQRNVLESFAQSKPGARKNKAEKRPKQLAAGDDEAHVDKYDFKSENVIELLKQLALKFEDDRLAGTKAETNAQNAHDLSMRARNNVRDAALKSGAKKSKEWGICEGDIKNADTNLDNTNYDLGEDSKSLEKTEKSCRINSEEWATRSNTRELEVEAMDQAVKILSKATGVRTKAPGNPVPPPSPDAPSPFDFLQILHHHNEEKQDHLVGSLDAKMKAVDLLKEAALSSHSRALERLAVEVAAHLSGPFDQVNNMIEKMIFHLQDEQKKEDEHKLWCDEEVKKTATMLSDKDDKHADLEAERKLEEAEVQELTSNIAKAEKMIADIESFMTEATETRQTGKRQNQLAIKDAQNAQNALANAIAVLTDFYKDSGKVAKEPWEFIQAEKRVDPPTAGELARRENRGGLPESPAVWGSEYVGAKDPDNQPGGIISVLEGVADNFSKMEAETKSQEAQDQASYEEDMKASKIEKTGRAQEVQMKIAEKARRSDKINSLSSSKKDTAVEIEKTEQYMNDLAPACKDGDKGVSYENRKASRDTEIEALKTAQVTLQDAFKEKEGLFLQKSK